MAIPINSVVIDTPPLDSASVIVLRDGPTGLEVLMMRRHVKSGVLGGVHVFPGGKLDASDRAVPAALFRLDDAGAASLPARMAEPGLSAQDGLAFLMAAVRETLEEAGMLLTTQASDAQVAQARAALAGDAAGGLAQVLQGAGVQLDAEGVWPWSRWITPRIPSVANKRFDTRFFVARAPTHHVASHDNHEASALHWLSAPEALGQYWNGEIDLAPPQIMTLAHLARFATVDEAMADARSRPPYLIQPEPHDNELGQRVLTYPGDPRHSLRDPVWPMPISRLTHRNQRFEAEGGLSVMTHGARDR